MSRGDWFRNTEWNPQTEERFLAKLSRAREKAQYIRIQACLLTRTHPRVALDLLEKYFASGDHFDKAQAYVDRANAYLALGEEEKAIEAYEGALAREDVFPNVRTQASIELPFLIATSRRRERYDRALELLGKKETLLLPVQFFKREASIALISADLGDEETARLHATRGLEIAGAQSSGLRYHSDLGLVGSNYESIQALLSAIVAK